MGHHCFSSICLHFHHIFDLYMFVFFILLCLVCTQNVFVLCTDSPPVACRPQDDGDVEDDMTIREVSQTTSQTKARTTHLQTHSDRIRHCGNELPGCAWCGSVVNIDPPTRKVAVMHLKAVCQPTLSTKEKLPCCSATSMLVLVIVCPHQQVAYH